MMAKFPSGTTIAAAVAGPFLVASATVAAESGNKLREAKIIGILGNKQVYINKELARINAVARSGGTIGTGGNSRARLLFDPRVVKDNIGLLKPNTRIKIGSRCFNLEDGEIWIDGPQNGCVGVSTIRAKGTSYVLARINEDTNRLAVMNGEALLINNSADDVSTKLSSESLDADLGTRSRFPRFSAIYGIGASAYTSNSGGVSFGDSSALVLGDVNLYAPLWQHHVSKVLYSYTSASSNFDGFWGASSEVGYRWFNAAKQSSQGVFIGYNGIEDPQCFHSQIALGAEYNPNRWFLGVNGAIRADDCESSTSYAMAQVGIPLAQIGDNTARLDVAPYLVTGLGNDYLGGRLGVSIPVSDHLTLSAYGQYDRLFDTVIGGSIAYRFGAGKHFISDPNRAPNPIPGASISRAVPARTMASTIPSAAAAMATSEPVLISQAAAGEVVKAGEEIVFTNQGQVIDRQRMSPARFRQLVESNLEGQDLLPERHLQTPLRWNFPAGDGDHGSSLGDRSQEPVPPSPGRRHIGDP
jgi:hypothetical protein